ncbi:MAG: MBL fold metallo-hydrolase [Pseudomonadota bacterium]
MALAVLAGGCLPPRPFDEQAWRGQVRSATVADLYAPHQDSQGRFFNPWQPRERSWGDLLYWLLSRNSLGDQGQSAPAVPVLANDGAQLADATANASDIAGNLGQEPPDQARTTTPTDPLSPSPGHRAVTWIGHATFAVQLGGPPVITDPFFGDRAGPVRRRTPPAFGPEKVPAGAVALISHNHYDHLDAPSVAALGGRVIFLCPLGLGELLSEMGARQVHELDWWQSLTIEGTTFTCLPAQHWSLRLGQAYNRSLWCSWLLERHGRRVFFSGDSGYFIGYREIGRRYPGIDAALISVGAYLPRWFMHYAHMDPAEALAAARDLGAKRLVPGHWGALQLGDEPISWLPGDLARAGQGRPPGANPRVTILPVGGSLTLE